MTPRSFDIGLTSRLLASTAFAVVALVIAGCGGDDDGDGSGGEATPVSFTTANEIKENSSREAVSEELAAEPVLVAEPTEEFPGGCDYYAMQNQPSTSVWEFCFGENGRLLLHEPEFSPANRPAPPDDASDQRAALLGAGDSVCEADYTELAEVTKEVGDALTVFTSNASKENTEAVGDAIDDFSANLEGTHEKLSAFDAPEDGLDALTAYLDSLQSQIEVLGQAKEAFLDGNIDEYDRFGNEFTEIGKDARTEAETYGFAVCSASDFG